MDFASSSGAKAVNASLWILDQVDSPVAIGMRMICPIAERSTGFFLAQA